MSGLSKLNILCGGSHQPFMNTRIAWVRQDLINTAPKHHIAAQEQADAAFPMQIGF